MPTDRFIGAAASAQIDRELDAIERERRVRILLAVESGSRAWGFPSPDSDYDVRFIYVRPIDAYLSVMPSRDVIERPPDGVLDINGWDLRKALQLVVRSNAVLLEWLASPVRYRECGKTAAAVDRLARETCALPSLIYHYHRLARHSFDEIAKGGPVKLKTYCCALRPALALLWMRARGAPPPMDLPGLLDGVEIPISVADTVDELVARKATSNEDDVIDRVPALDALLDDTLALPAAPAALSERQSVALRADLLFAAVLRGELG